MSSHGVFDWVREFPGGVTVCDADGIVLAMNEKSIRTFEKSGGAKLIGSSLFACHPDAARTKLKELLRAGRTNVYTIEKQGIRKLIYQSPWYEQGEYRGFVELSLEIPSEIPHFVRGE
jgi:hypothetical protein